MTHNITQTDTVTVERGIPRSFLSLKKPVLISIELKISTKIIDDKSKDRICAQNMLLEIAFTFSYI